MPLGRYRGWGRRGKWGWEWLAGWGWGWGHRRVGQKHLHSSGSDANATCHCVLTLQVVYLLQTQVVTQTQPIIVSWHSKLPIVADTDFPRFLHVNILKFMILRRVRHRSRSFILSKMSGKSKVDCQQILLTPLLWSAREFCESASTIDNFTRPDLNDQWTVTMHSGKMWRKLRLAVTIKDTPMLNYITI